MSNDGCPMTDERRDSAEAGEVTINKKLKRHNRNKRTDGYRESIEPT